MPRVKRIKSGFISTPPPGFRSFMNDLWAYSHREKRVYAAYTVVTLCRFGRWLTWALIPWFRFFPAWTDQVDGKMSWEMRAQLSLRPDPNLPFLMGLAGLPLAATKKFSVRK